MNANRIRVLFVDDEEGNLKAFKSTFRREMEVLLASSGQEALDLLDREPVDVIISDQRMPGMTGSELLAIVRHRHPRPMRMLLTGYADLEAVIAAVNEGGIYAYATKPWDANDLKLRIEQAYEILLLRQDREDLLHRYRQIFEVSGDPIAIVDRKGAIVEANQACARLLKVDRNVLLAGRFTDHLNDPRQLVSSLKRHRSGHEFVNVDLTLRNSQGDLVDCLMTATYLGRDDVRGDLFQAILKDVTDRRQEEARLRKLNADLDRRVTARTAQLLEALEDLASFSYTVAHDLRSPLKNIAALSDHLLLHAKDRSDVESLAFTERIHKGAQRMIDLVDDLLRFSQTNNRELDLRSTDLLTLVQELVAEQVPEDRRTQVRIDIAPEVYVMADAPMLKVVLQNLLSNALKFTRTAASPQITINCQQEQDRDVIRVQDNGVGFDQQHAQQVFGAFKRLHQTDQFEGTGVGLAIVQRIVSKHGGTAWAESAVGRGTTLSIALPHAAGSMKRPDFMKVA